MDRANSTEIRGYESEKTPMDKAIEATRTLDETVIQRGESWAKVEFAPLDGPSTVFVMTNPQVAPDYIHFYQEESEYFNKVHCSVINSHLMNHIVADIRGRYNAKKCTWLLDRVKSQLIPTYGRGSKKIGKIYIKDNAIHVGSDITIEPIAIKGRNASNLSVTLEVRRRRERFGKVSDGQSLLIKTVIDAQRKDGMDAINAFLFPFLDDVVTAI